MQYTTFLFTLVVSFFSQIGYASDSNDRPIQTILVYMATDHSVQPYIDFNIKQLEREGVPEDLTLLIFVCGLKGPQHYKAKKIRIRGHKGAVVQTVSRQGVTEKDMLLEALVWAAGFGSEKYGLIIRSLYPSHNTAHVGICLDEKSKRFLSDRDLREVLEASPVEKPFAFVGFDGCRTATVEIAAALAPYTSYMLGSGHYAPIGGWPYHWLLKALKEGKRNPLALGRALIHAYRDYYSLLIQKYSIAFFDLRHIEQLRIYLDEMKLFADSKNVKARHLIVQSVKKVGRFKETGYVDLAAWYNLLLRQPAFDKSTKNRLEQGLQSIRDCVIAMAHGKGIGPSGGLLVYLPTTQKKDVHAYAKSYWAETSGWKNFVEHI